jgi:polysaccharide pyruvyl transferase WcaK-like protein
MAVKDLIHHILNTTDMTLALTPHVMEDGNNDYEILHSYYEDYKDNRRVILLPNHLNATQYKGFISRMRFFIGARTHATIAAYSNFVPTMVLGYSIKSKGISKDIFGEEKLVLSIDEISSSLKLIAKFDEMVREEKELRLKLQKSIPHIKKMSYKAVEHLDKLIQ